MNIALDLDVRGQQGIDFFSLEEAILRIMDCILKQRFKVIMLILGCYFTLSCIKQCFISIFCYRQHSYEISDAVRSKWQGDGRKSVFVNKRGCRSYHNLNLVLLPLLLPLPTNLCIGSTSAVPSRVEFVSEWRKTNLLSEQKHFSVWSII